MAEDPEATRLHSQLFHNKSHTVVLIDVPRSIEEVQVLSSKLRHGSVALKRLVSSKPLEQPFLIPEPRNGNLGLTDSVSDLMSTAAAANALEVLRKAYSGPWCLPRITSTGQTEGIAEGQKRKRHTSPDGYGLSKDAGMVILPVASTYLLGTISSERERFLKEAPIFELIVLDPPWPNRSVRRKKNSYKIANNSDEIRETLSSIPVSTHLAPDGILAVWITNKASVLALVTGPDGLLDEWGLELVDEWVWLKVTTAGEPIIDLESSWRRPFERLLIARRRGSKITLSSRGKVLVSVPDLHSRKPSLRGLFDDVFAPDYKGLEVFARNLTAGWWSWGDEALKFQEADYWKETI